MAKAKLTKTKQNKKFKLSINSQTPYTWSQLEKLITTVKNTVVSKNNRDKALDALITMHHAYPFMKGGVQ